MTVAPPSPELKAGFQKIGVQLTADWEKRPASRASPSSRPMKP